jgi:hypothetical protein
VNPLLPSLRGEPSLSVEGDVVRARLTPRGGMLGPVEFTLPGGRIVQPYSLAPWTPAEAPGAPPLLQVLRGDFFCFPFGETPGVPGPHGPAANESWTVLEGSPGQARLRLQSAGPVATIEKRLDLRPGHTALYQEHVVTTDGRFNYGHHPILQVPLGVTAEVRTSAFGFGGVYPGAAQRPPGERGALAPGARFARLDSVPLAGGGTTSLARYPARPGTEDIVMVSRFASPRAWTALTLDGYVWFSLRRTADFPATLFWMSNGGRSFPPWNGRHVRRIGIEDVCSHYCDGAHISARDLLAGEAIATSRRFSAAQPARLRHIQGVVAVPPGFGGVADLGPAPDQPLTTARLRDERGATVTFPLDWNFLPA